MSAISTYFTDFLEEIRLPPDLRASCERAHLTLRAKLMADRDLSKIIVSTFLQGSYRRHTGVRPLNDGELADVDVVVVTTLDPRQWTPAMVLEQLFKPFLDREYPDQWETNDRSIKISPTGSKVTIDLVPTSAPSEIEQELLEAFDPEFRIEARGDTDSKPILLREARERLQKMFEAADWQREPLMIPSRDLERWVPTHPIAQIYWTEQKSVSTSGHYVNVVKAVKWWRKRHADGEYPKAYPLEHIVGQTCPDGIDSIAAGVTRTLEVIRDTYRIEAATGQVPYLRDHGVDQNVFRRITPEQFAIFWRLVSGAAGEARAAFDAETVQESASRWRNLLGPEFPAPKESGFVAPIAPATPRSGGRFG